MAAGLRSFLGFWFGGLGALPSDTLEIEQAIYSRLSGYSAIAALVGDRIFPNVREQDTTLPCIDFRRVSTSRFPAMHSTPHVVQARFQFDIWAAYDDYATAIEIKNEIYNAMERWATTTGIVVYDAFVLSEHDLFESESRQRHIAIDIEIHYSE